ncbi:DUF2797 domain-containing protein [Myroides marinus]|uniref:DUF2797 domain-containing protein n=1 Tax=Myroides marinus TaxID=703342 RepID=UPI0025781A14|nr:DUF2797 domain-containing protein [Myroides marinus]MDM1367279.1 DUF2797 domain-containing protein [Myroides marinus]MDM1374508.1 DUF2797 domain-containing protein [Myroides marinus]MDM1381662.1 DUF2797 domain-containing protein [Myroides marinus]
MLYEGVLNKMQTEFNTPIEYYLVFKNNFININQIIDRDIKIDFTGYECLNCGQHKKIFRQGFCYECFYSSAQVGDWIMRPELSKAHLGIEDRDLEYEMKVQLQPHIVYLAVASDVKVGVTRKTQVPTRWIDQGASKAIEIVEVPNRYLAGITEVALKDMFTDKTNWRKMLQNEVLETNLEEIRNSLKDKLPDEVKPYFDQTNSAIFNLDYPVLQFPKKITSLNLDKTPSYQGKLKGVKGQYLLFEDGTVFNIRTYEGYMVNIEVI